MPEGTVCFLNDRHELGDDADMARPEVRVVKMGLPFDGAWYPRAERAFLRENEPDGGGGADEAGSEPADGAAGPAAREGTPSSDCGGPSSLSPSSVRAGYVQPFRLSDEHIEMSRRLRTLLERVVSHRAAWARKVAEFLDSHVAELEGALKRAEARMRVEESVVVVQSITDSLECHQLEQTLDRARRHRHYAWWKAHRTAHAAREFRDVLNDFQVAMLADEHIRAQPRGTPPAAAEEGDAQHEDQLPIDPLSRISRIPMDGFVAAGVCGLLREVVRDETQEAELMEIAKRAEKARWRGCGR